MPENAVLIKKDDLVPNMELRSRDNIFNQIDKMAKSIKNRGIAQPLLVKPNENGKFEIIAGNRRYFAGKEAGLLEFPCLIKKDFKEEKPEKLGIFFSENFMRIQPTKTQEIDFIRKVMSGDTKGHRITYQEIADATGWTFKQIQKIGLQHKLVGRARLMLEKGEIAKSATEDLAPLPPKEQERVLNDLERLGMRPSADNIRRLSDRKAHPKPISLSKKKKIKISIADAYERKEAYSMAFSEIVNKNNLIYGVIQEIMKYEDIKTYLKKNYKTIYDDFVVLVEFLNEKRENFSTFA